MNRDNYSNLPAVLERAMPKQVGHNPKTLKRIFAAPQDELDTIQGHLDATATTLATAIAAMGKLIVYTARHELTDRDWNEVGHFMVTAGESLMTIRNMEAAIQDGEPQS